MPSFDEYVKQSTEALNNVYDQRRTNRLAELENTYQQNLGNAKAAREQIPATYQQQANDLSVQYERNRRNLNEQIAANGLNTGTASQAALAANQSWMKNYGNLRTAQANAIKEADRGINELTKTYNTKREAAAAEIEADRAEAMLRLQQTAQQEQYERDLRDAQTRAGFGDFTGFLALGYDQNTIDNMRQVWIAQNPLLAYNTGAITADQYYKMTGKSAPGAPSAAGGGGYYYGVGATDGGLTDKSGGNDVGIAGATAVANGVNTVKNALVTGTKAAGNFLQKLANKNNLDGISGAAPASYRDYLANANLTKLLNLYDKSTGATK